MDHLELRNKGVLDLLHHLIFDDGFGERYPVDLRWYWLGEDEFPVASPEREELLR